MNREDEHKYDLQENGGHDPLSEVFRSQQVVDQFWIFSDTLIEDIIAEDIIIDPFE